MDLVCPDCGNSTFKQQRTTITEFKLSHDEGAGWYETAEEVMDGGDMGDHEIVCDDCGWECVSEDDLVTEEAYNESEEADECVYGEPWNA